MPAPLKLYFLCFQDWFYFLVAKYSSKKKGGGETPKSETNKKLIFKVKLIQIQVPA